ncbi:MAG: hypothetical protein IKH19_09650 [Muribaculaceae bacterium]|nr:hypothetical protein [Muribaculaceae bacterium]
MKAVAKICIIRHMTMDDTHFFSFFQPFYSFSRLEKGINHLFPQKNNPNSTFANQGHSMAQTPKKPLQWLNCTPKVRQKTFGVHYVSKTFI